MRKLIPVYVRVPLILAIAYFAMEYFIDSGDKPAFMVYPAVSIFLGALLLVLIAIEVVFNAFENITYSIMTEEQRREYDERNKLNLDITQSATYKKIMQALTKSKGIEEEGELLMEHDYDGIKELDNVLPPWWKYLFYATVIFSFVYLGYYHLFGGENQIQEYERKNNEALLAIEEWKKTAVDLVDASNVIAMTDDSNLAAGKNIYMERCVACHLADGGGSIGPNLTDDYWILGGGIKEIFHTVSEGGREGKGMIPWKTELKPVEIQQVSSYILSLVGTTPAVAKEPEGELWVQAGDETTDKEIDTETVLEE
ncbi:MAG: cbb3-type cytochrome c oxidase N-terminal domain-containing protein [Flavobacteriaceae bacterium]